jgi:hypothetical protein
MPQNLILAQRYTGADILTNGVSGLAAIVCGECVWSSTSHIIAQSTFHRINFC